MVVCAYSSLRVAFSFAVLPTLAFSATYLAVLHSSLGKEEGQLKLLVLGILTLFSSFTSSSSLAEISLLLALVVAVSCEAMYVFGLEKIASYLAESEGLLFGREEYKRGLRKMFLRIATSGTKFYVASVLLFYAGLALSIRVYSMYFAGLMVLLAVLLVSWLFYESAKRRGSSSASRR